MCVRSEDILIFDFLILVMEAKHQQRRVDIINVVLEECIMAYPVSSFIISLYKQYQQRGSLSKKQLQGLYAKASEIKDLVSASGR